MGRCRRSRRLNQLVAELGTYFYCDGPLGLLQAGIWLELGLLAATLTGALLIATVLPFSLFLFQRLHTDLGPDIGPASCIRNKFECGLHIIHRLGLNIDQNVPDYLAEL